MITISGSASKSLMARYVGAVFDRRYYLDPQHRRKIDVECSRVTHREFSDLQLFYTESNLGRREYHSQTQVLVGGIQPNMIIGMLLGAELKPTSDADADISEKCLAGVRRRTLPNPDGLLEHELVQQFASQLRAINQDSGSDLVAVPPFFWDLSGRAAVHGAVTSGLKFVGDEFLMEMITDPDGCQQLVDWLTEVSAVLVGYFADLAGIQLTGIHIGECAACMLDVVNFQRYVLPSVLRLGQAFGPVRFHSCGKSDHLIEEFTKIETLASLDVGGETSVGRIRDVFGRDFPVGIAPLVEDMRAGCADGILTWFERVCEENQDGDLTIGYHLEADYNVENLRALHRAVSSSV